MKNSLNANYFSQIAIFLHNLPDSSEPLSSYFDILFRIYYFLQDGGLLEDYSDILMGNQSSVQPHDFKYSLYAENSLLNIYS